jgi:GT2 family glycosyltransferase
VLLTRTDFLRSLGGFREEFFMYTEAVELCLRAARAGRRLAVVPRARAAHFEPPEGVAGPSALEFHKLKNFLALYLLHAPARVLPEFFCRYVLLGALRSLAGRGATPGAFGKAVWWAARRAPALLVERRRAARRDAGGARRDDGEARPATPGAVATGAGSGD